MARPPIHPGEILGDELREMKVSHGKLGRDIDVSGTTISRIVRGEQAITADTAYRLSHWFGNDPRFWLNLQDQYDLRVAEKALGGKRRSWRTKDDLIHP